jgi:gas vesicle protein
MATKKPMKKPVKRVRRFQEGGETADKMAGLAASNMDAPMGFFERLRMGNIDREGSEAYNRLGAGRGRGERAALSELAGMTASNNAMPVKNAEDGAAQNVRIADAQGAREMDEEMYQRGRRAGEEVDSAERMQGYKPRAAAQNAAILAGKVKPASTKPAAPATRPAAAAPAAPAVAPAADSARAIPGASATQAVTAASPERERLPEVTGMSNLEKLLVGTGVGGGLAGLAGLGLKARNSYRAAQAARMGARKRADLKDQTIDQINQARKADGRQQITSDAPTKTSSNLKQQAKDQINEARKADGRPPLEDSVMKRGGRVKKMASGGSVKSSTASKRGDGIALRGKTRGKIY